LESIVLFVTLNMANFPDIRFWQADEHMQKQEHFFFA